ncbi:hypothetical protein SAMN04489713_104382 [Actinomadura madurae]|uniref:Uncharacterized protein n=1 Tax=Actinomadura madurae TaxID=1993 RepID=A0A1I5F1E6_9ACTN|nr:hypothetical protein SAMN04489713_104382 [Actinomadura madurae]
MGEKRAWCATDTGQVVHGDARNATTAEANGAGDMLITAVGRGPDGREAGSPHTGHWRFRDRSRAGWL